MNHWVAKIIGPIFFIALSAAILHQQDFFPFKGVEVSVIGAISTNQKENLIQKSKKNFKSYIGRSNFSFSLKEVVLKIESDPQVKEVRVRREIYGKTKVQLILEKPLLFLIDSKNQLHVIMNEGELISNDRIFTKLDLPFVRGDFFKKDLNLRLELLDFYHAVPEKGLFSKDLVSEIRYDEGIGFSVYLVSSGTLVKLGKEKLPIKLKQIERVMSYLKSQDQQSKVIDARLPKKVIVKLRNQS